MKFIKLLLKFFLNKLIFLITIPLRINYLKREIIILQTYKRNIYCENTKYLYEYLSSSTKFDVYWVTNNNIVIKYLQNKNYKYINIYKNPVFFLYITLNTKIVIDSGTDYFNPFNLLKSDVIKISTHHGSGLKNTPVKKYQKQEIKNFSRIDYINNSSKFLIEKTGKELFKISEKKLLNFGFPRCDQFFDKNLIISKYNNKKVAKYLSQGDFKSTSKIILYTPTWRPYDYEFPLFKLKNFELEIFNEFLKKNDIYFFYSFHMAKHPNKIPNNLERIIYIDRDKYPFYDTCAFMCEVDILINDYSSTSTDFGLLNRPQIFFMPDFERFDEEYVFTEEYKNDYKKIIPGNEFFNYSEMISLIIKYLNEPIAYQLEFKEKLAIYLSRYYDTNKGDACEKFKKFIIEKMKNFN